MITLVPFSQIPMLINTAILVSYWTWEIFWNECWTYTSFVLSFFMSDSGTTSLIVISTFTSVGLICRGPCSANSLLTFPLANLSTVCSFYIGKRWHLRHYWTLAWCTLIYSDSLLGQLYSQLVNLLLNQSRMRKWNRKHLLLSFV